MEVNCEGCAGCCMDWTALLDPDEGEFEDETVATTDSDPGSDRNRPRGRFGDDDAANRAPLDSDANFVPLTRDEVRTFLEQGMAAALTLRFWHARDEREAVEIDGRHVAAIADRPVFFVGLRKPPKPVAPFGRDDPTWLPTCVFLDPTTLQCRIHGDERFPAECGSYPAHNLELGQETECERVEAVFGGERLLDDQVTADDADGPLLGSQAVGEKLFCHPEPAALEGVVERVANGTLQPTDRAECLAVASASSPGTLAISEHHYEWGKERALEALTASKPRSESGEDASDQPTDDSHAGSWVGPAIRAWHQRRATAADAVPPTDVATTVEEDRGAPETPGWAELE